MNADFVRKEAAFMDWHLPKKDQRTVDDRMVVGDAGAMDPTHICITFIGHAADKMMNDPHNEFTYDLYDEVGEFRGSQKIIPLSNNNQRVAVDRNTLMKLLEAMTSSYVVFDVATDYPVRIVGMIGEKNAAALIAPRIED